MSDRRGAHQLASAPTSKALFFTVLVLLAISLASALGRQPEERQLRATPVGHLPEDRRLGPLRTLNSYFPAHQVSTREEWQRRAIQLRRQTQVALGLWPPPPKSPLDAVSHGKVFRDRYTVEKVYFQSFPGHYVTGNLYRPRGRRGRLPAVLSPHGHTGSERTLRSSGRFHAHSSEQIRELIAQGAERFELGGRYPLQARAVQLARMGSVVFQYDMVGYADSLQLPHKGLGVRPNMNTPERWGFSSPQAELRLQNLMGLQTWNSIRALDFLLSLPDVDPERVAVEGHSGGGTQTFILTALDDRPTVAFPAVMVSTAMQGGCICENAPFLRIGAGNIDLAALTAPRPLGMTGADDWTLEIAEKGLPDLQRLYELLGNRDGVMARVFPQFGHNYNSVSRTVMYNWLNRHLGLGFAEPVIEQDFRPLTRREMSVWNASHPPPSGDQVGEAHERDLLQHWTSMSEDQLAASEPTDEASLAEFRRRVGGGFDVILGRRLEDVEAVQYRQTSSWELDSARAEVGLLRNQARDEELPLLVLHPRGGSQGKFLIWVDKEGKTGLTDAGGGPRLEVTDLLSAGFSVVGVDLLYQGEFLQPGESAPEKTRLTIQSDGSQPWHFFAAYTFGYNYSLFSLRVQDILSVIRGLQEPPFSASEINLVGFGEVAGPLAAGALAQSQGSIQRAAIDTAGFRFALLDRFDHPMFLPGAVKYGDLPGLLALCSELELWLAGEERAPESVLAAAFRAAGASSRLNLYADEEEPSRGAVAWLKR